MNYYCPFDNEIDAALQSGISGTYLEGEVADILRKNGKNIVSFQRKETNFGVGIGDVDIETDNAIIEVTQQKQNKLGQLRKLQIDSQLNPSGKPIILYGPYYKSSGVSSTRAAGFLVAQNFQELLDILANL